MRIGIPGAEGQDKRFFYTNGQTLQELGIGNSDDYDKLPKYTFDGTDKSIAFNLFCYEEQSGQTNTLNSISLNHATVKKTYIQNETLDLSGLVVTANYSDGSREVTDYSSDPAHDETLSTTGEITVTVSYTEGTVTETADFTVTVISSGDVITVTNTMEWNTALTTISNGGNNQSYIIHVSGNIEVEGSANNTFGNVSGLSVALTGNGKLYLTSQGSIVRIGANQTLIIDSAGLTLQGISSNNTSLVYIDATTAKVELRNGTISCNTNTNTSSNNGGGGVHMEVGSFTMTEGEISVNTAAREGGGVYVAGGTFAMTGGEISVNTANTQAGGGVMVRNGTFTMGGTAKISDNTVNGAGEGGGVSVVGGTFTMNDGIISGNTATNGGGVMVGIAINFEGQTHVFDGTFRIVKGTVYGSNEANTSLRNTATSGAALHVFSNNSISTAQRGTFNSSGNWVSAGSLYTDNSTIWVVNGVQQ